MPASPGRLAALRCDGARELPLSEPAGWALRYATAACSKGDALPSAWRPPPSSLVTEGDADVRGPASGCALGETPFGAAGAAWGCALGGGRPFCSAWAKLPSRGCHAVRLLPASEGAAELGSPPASKSDNRLADPLRVAAGTEESDDLSSSSFSCVSRERGFLPAGAAALACCSVGPKASPSWSAGLGGEKAPAPCGRSDPDVPPAASRPCPFRCRLPLPRCCPLPLQVTVQTG